MLIILLGELERKAKKSVPQLATLAVDGEGCKFVDEIKGRLTQMQRREIGKHPLSSVRVPKPPTSIC